MGKDPVQRRTSSGMRTHKHNIVDQNKQLVVFGNFDCADGKLNEEQLQ